jgi:hypothetical protein
MYKLVKLLGVLVVLASSMGHASAATLIENFIFSYSTNGSFTLSNLSYTSTSAPGVNLLTVLSPYTTLVGGSLSGTGKLSQYIAVDTTQNYLSNYNVSNATGNAQSFSIAVSPVPLPAGFPLFAMALICLGVIGYHTARTNSRVSAAG